MRKHVACLGGNVVSTSNNHLVDRTNDTKILRPTIEAYEALECAFDFFNIHIFKRSFDVVLPHVMLTMPKSRRYQGYFQQDNWQSDSARDLQASEIALNPRFFGSQCEVCQTLVHEMVHLGQTECPDIFGHPSPRGYHNKNFAKSMIAIGLMPSSTGKPGGKMTGIAMSDYVIHGGLFARSYERFVQSGYAIRWSSETLENKIDAEDGSTTTDDTERERKLKQRSKTKYTCSVCGLNAWAKPQAKLACVNCTVVMQENQS